MDGGEGWAVNNSLAEKCNTSLHVCIWYLRLASDPFDRSDGDDLLVFPTLVSAAGLLLYL